MKNEESFKHNILYLVLPNSAKYVNVISEILAKRGCAGLRVEIFCPVCAAAGIRRKLLEVDSFTRGVIWPWCKGCKKNVKIELPLKK